MAPIWFVLMMFVACVAAQKGGITLSPRYDIIFDGIVSNLMSLNKLTSFTMTGGALSNVSVFQNSTSLKTIAIQSVIWGSLCPIFQIKNIQSINLFLINQTSQPACSSVIASSSLTTLGYATSLQAFNTSNFKFTQLSFIDINAPFTSDSQICDIFTNNSSSFTILPLAQSIAIGGCLPNITGATGFFSFGQVGSGFPSNDIFPTANLTEFKGAYNPNVNPRVAIISTNDTVDLANFVFFGSQSAWEIRNPEVVKIVFTTPEKPLTWNGVSTLMLINANLNFTIWPTNNITYPSQFVLVVNGPMSTVYGTIPSALCGICTIQANSFASIFTLSGLQNRFCCTIQDSSDYYP